MGLNLYSGIADSYKSKAQKIRVLSEAWVYRNIYCPNCGGSIAEYENNKPVADFFCALCREDYELKSKGGKSLGKIIPDGKYDSMISRIMSQNSPNFLFLNYDKKSFDIINFIAVPNYIFLPDMIRKRGKGLPDRENYIMCNIDISTIPQSCKVYYIKDKKQISKNQVIQSWQKTKFLQQSKDIDSKGWLLDIIRCIEKLNRSSFTLNDIYIFEEYLKQKHPKNSNIRAKIRQQLQILRDKGYLKFISRGNYQLC